jgi:hypothetical protein
MGYNCTRCQGTGFLNIDHLTDEDRIYLDKEGPENFLEWLELTGQMESGEEYEDVQVCDCCGDGESWHGVPGEHYNSEDPRGDYGPYAYNGGLCECH